MGQDNFCTCDDSVKREAETFHFDIKHEAGDTCVGNMDNDNAPAQSFQPPVSMVKTEPQTEPGNDEQTSVAVSSASHHLEPKQELAFEPKSSEMCVTDISVAVDSQTTVSEASVNKGLTEEDLVVCAPSTSSLCDALVTARNPEEQNISDSTMINTSVESSEIEWNRRKRALDEINLISNAYIGESVGKRPPKDMKRLKPGRWYEVLRVAHWGEIPAVLLAPIIPPDEADLIVKPTEEPLPEATADPVLTPTGIDTGVKPGKEREKVSYYKPPAAYQGFEFQVGDKLKLKRVGYSKSRNLVALAIDVEPVKIPKRPRMIIDESLATGKAGNQKIIKPGNKTPNKAKRGPKPKSIIGQDISRGLSFPLHSVSNLEQPSSNLISNDGTNVAGQGSMSNLSILHDYMKLSNLNLILQLQEQARPNTTASSANYGEASLNSYLQNALDMSLSQMQLSYLNNLSALNTVAGATDSLSYLPALASLVNLGNVGRMTSANAGSVDFNSLTTPELQPSLAVISGNSHSPAAEQPKFKVDPSECEI